MDSFESAILPVLPLKDLVVFPNAISPISVGRPESLAALDAALKADRRIFLVSQRESEVERPERDDLYQIGTVCEILQALRMPDETAKVLVEGVYAARATDFLESGNHSRALLVRQEVADLDTQVAKAYMRTALALFESFSKLSDKVPEELFLSIKGIEDPTALVHAVSNYSTIGVKEKQAILEAQSLEEKYMMLNANLEKENQVLQLEDEIVSQVKNQIGQSQREYFLNEQLKAIEKELGIGEEEAVELDDMGIDIEAAKMPEEARAKAEKELSRLTRMPPLSPEATVSRTYIEWMVEVPWFNATDDAIDLKKARAILDEDHHGLEKVKERIVEYLAVTKLAGQAKGPILCLVGPPGVGKTSLAKSVARSIGRKFSRISLGGVRDEAEIRGHRRTYVGAMPGKIIQSMKKSGTVNPVILLDEIDKMSSDFRGDPASAMLEVLDPEQNKHFNDHYLEVDYDLSRVLFITTANTMQGIPLPLQDRMEIIRISGYTNLEKLEIARRHLVPKSLKGNGLKKTQVKFQKSAIEFLIHGYTRESGVRSLEREINSVCRKLAMQLVETQEAGKTAKPVSLTADAVKDLLGPVKFKDSALDQKPEIGNVIGMAWTEVGGELLHVETRVMAGKGVLTLTGKLGDVMQESGKMALSLIRSQAEQLGVDPRFNENTDIHVHLPEGAIPKDGPSAGISLATSIVSALSKRPVRQDIAMTGELTLRGKVLKIGGLKEKVLAAYRNRIRTVIIPEENLPDLEDIPAEVRAKTTFAAVRDLGEVLKIALADKSKAAKKPSKTKDSRPRPTAQ